MTKREILKKDWFIALVLAIIFLSAALSRSSLLGDFERLAYDAGVRMTNRSTVAADNIAIIAIDDDSIKNLGRWPWPRSTLADMLRWLGQARAKAIGFQVLFSEPQVDPGLGYIRRLGELLRDPRVARSAPRDLAAVIREAEAELNTDRKLAEAIPAGRSVWMPMFFQIGNPLGEPEAVPGYVLRNRLARVRSPERPRGKPPRTRAVIYPLPEFGSAVAGLGHLNVEPDQDGAVRGESLVLEYGGNYYPSLALLMAARSLNVKPSDITVTLGEGVQVGNLFIKTDPEMYMLAGFYPIERGKDPFPTYSFFDVRSGRIPAANFAGKLVLIGSTAQGVGAAQPTPVSPAMSGPQVTANIITSIINQDFYSQPAWVWWAEAAIFLVITLYLMFLLPAMPAGPAAFVSFVLFVTLVGGEHYLLVSEQVWVQAMSAAVLLLVGHVLLTTRGFFVTERLKARVESDSAHTSRMLGLSFQGQGQLDMAMDKFRLLPVDDGVLDLIYNLALDFERKRQFAKAMSAYDYILEHKSGFRDVAKRRKRAQKVDSTLIMGGGRAGPGGTLVLDTNALQPTLGRYQIEKELGQGAMGAVYLGRDPKINRVVAIKTMALAQEFSGDELEGVKQRFFREAETAGRLSHPNIVTIYDAGEEHDLAYIAMEYLQGQDLTHHTESKTLLPLAEVGDIICKVAEALTYAHDQGVVHRDIKPANIMYDRERGATKVTDFGIARITASSGTKTGVILGTPSYMSPEQLAGTRVDGRSDLFSLGVTLFELLVGQQPFSGDSMATLMYQIANARHPDITTLRSDLPACLKTVVDKALQKQPDKRYQTGTEFSQALSKCLRRVSATGAA